MSLSPLEKGAHAMRNMVTRAHAMRPYICLKQDLGEITK